MASTAASSALTVPSSAPTGLPSVPLIDFGSPWKERYSSHGTSAISSGAAIAAKYRYPADTPPVPLTGVASGVACAAADPPASVTTEAGVAGGAALAGDFPPALGSGCA